MDRWWVALGCVVAMVVGACGDAPPPTVSAFEPQTALLTLTEMPEGFTVSQPLPAIGLDQQPCSTPLPLRRRLVRQAAATYTRGMFGPFVAQTVALFRPGQTRTLMDQTRAAFEACRAWTDTRTEPPAAERRAVVMAFPTLGDQSFAVRVDTRAILAAAHADLIFIRRGDVIMLVGVLASGTIEAGLTEQVARMADTKLYAAMK